MGFRLACEFVSAYYATNFGYDDGNLNYLVRAAHRLHGVFE